MGEGTAVEQVAVTRLSELPDGDYRAYAIDQFEVGIFRLGDKVIAYRNECPHAGGGSVRARFFVASRKH
jgi:nitrite reductase/ring-hydroxylating ferredoxin subunit